jgi:hypothetical protein
LNIRFNQWEEATRMMETYEAQFYTDLDAAWNGYVDDTLETVQMEMAVHREVVGDTIDYLWDRSAYPGPSLDEVYPRPSVAFAAKNAKRITPKTDTAGIYAGIAAGSLAIASVLAHYITKTNGKVVQ